MTNNPALDALKGAYDTVHAVVDAGLPLLIGVTALAVAARWAIDMLSPGMTEEEYDDFVNH